MDIAAFLLTFMFGFVSAIGGLFALIYYPEIKQFISRTREIVIDKYYDFKYK